MGSWIRWGRLFPQEGSAEYRVRLPGVDLAPSVVVTELSGDRIAPQPARGNAAVTIVVFTDYQCAVCRIDHPGFARLAAGRPDVNLVYKEWAILGPASRRAARVALAADYQGRYQAARDTLMRVNVADQSAVARALVVAGLDLDRLARDLATHSGAIDRELARTSRQAFALGLSGTPAYLIGRRLVLGRLDESKLERLIARARAKARE